jgi:tRNA(fMet)-specific endonuclease VapC
VADRYVVVDTDVFIWLIRGKAQATDYAPLVEGRHIVLSFATVAELWLGAERRGYGDGSRRELESRIAVSVVVRPTHDLTVAWARIVAQARGMSPGHPLGQQEHAHDAWVATTAIHHGLPLLTGNQRHFAGLPGLDLVDVPDAAT